MSGGKVEIRLNSKSVKKRPLSEVESERAELSTKTIETADETAIVEVEGKDVIRLILQHLKENNLSRSFHALQEESNVYLNAVANKDEILAQIQNGDMSKFLQLVGEMDLPQEIVFSVFEHVALELLETGDETALGLFMKSTNVFTQMAKKEPLRYRRLEALKAKETRLSTEELWGEISKFKKRKTIGKEVLNHVPQIAAGRLLTLLNIAIKTQKEQGFIPGGSKYNLFENVTISDRGLCEMPATNIRHVISLDNPKAIIRSAIFSVEGNSVITGDSDGEILVWSWMTGKLRSDLKYQLEGFVMNHYQDDNKASPVTALALSQDGKILASGDESGTIKIWRLDDGKLVRSFSNVHKKSIRSIDFHPAQPQILTASADGTAKVTLLKSKGSVLKSFDGHGGFVSNAFYQGKKSKHVVTGCSDGYFRVFKFDSGDIINKITPPKEESTLSFSGVESLIPDPRNENQVFVCQRSPKIHCFSTKGDLIKIFDSQLDEDFLCIAASPQGEFLMGLTEKGTQVAFNCASGEQVAVLSARVKTPSSYGIIYHHTQNIGAIWGSSSELLVLQG